MSAAEARRALLAKNYLMSALSIATARFPWARAAVVALATLLAHALVFERVQRMLVGAVRVPAPGTTVSARLLPPPVTVAPPPPAVMSAAPKRRAAPARPQPVPVAPAVSPAPAVAVEVAADVPAEAAPEMPPIEPRAEMQEQAEVVLNAERPTDRGAVAEAAEFDASGEAVREALSTVALHSALPSAAHYVYRTTYSELRLASGTTTIDWGLADGGRYRLRLGTTALGITVIELQSEGWLRDFGLAPERYTETRARRGTVAANFDWDSRRITFSARAHERPLADGVQDRISFQFQLMLLGQARPERFRNGRQTVLHVAGRDDVAVYRFVSAGRDTTTTGLGQLDTVRVERVVTDISDARIEVWLAPDLGWVPARLRFTDRQGRVTESVLEALQT